MARPGISQQDVFTAADEIAGQGRAPTIDLIRQRLHTGSNSTIANHLREWRALHSDSQFAGHSQGLPPEMIAVMKSLWERMVSHSHRQMNDAVAPAVEATALQAELQKYKTNNQKWQTMFNTWMQEKEQLSQEKSLLEKTIAELQDSHAALQNQNDELQQLMQQLQTSLNEQSDEQIHYNALLKSYEQLELSVENQAKELSDCIREKTELMRQLADAKAAINAVTFRKKLEE